MPELPDHGSLPDVCPKCGALGCEFTPTFHPYWSQTPRRESVSWDCRCGYDVETKTYDQTYPAPAIFPDRSVENG